MSNWLSCLKDENKKLREELSSLKNTLKLAVNYKKLNQSKIEICEKINNLQGNNIIKGQIRNHHNSEQIYSNYKLKEDNIDKVYQNSCRDDQKESRLLRNYLNTTNKSTKSTATNRSLSISKRNNSVKNNEKCLFF